MKYTGIKGRKTQHIVKREINRLGTEITQMLELIDREIKIIMLNILMSLVVKIDSICEHMGNFDKGM